MIIKRFDRCINFWPLLCNTNLIFLKGMICEIKNNVTVHGHNEDVGLGVNNFIGNRIYLEIRKNILYVKKILGLAH